MNRKDLMGKASAGICTTCAEQKALLDLEKGWFEIEWLPPVLKALYQYANSGEVTAPLMLPPQVLFDGEGQKTILIYHFHEGKSRHFCLGFPLTPQQIETATEEFLGLEINVWKGK